MKRTAFCLDGQAGVHCRPLVIFWMIALMGLGVVAPTALHAQVVAPDEREIFQEDADRFQEGLSRKRKSLMTPTLPGTGQVDFTAPTVKFDQEENVISGSGGVLISGQGFRIQGERGSVDLDTNDARLEERVVLSGESTRLTAEKLQFNLDAEVGEFEDTTFTLEDSAFQFSAGKAEKLNDVEFEMEDCSLTTCACEDGDVPWRLRATRVNAEREGYAHTYNPVFEFQGVPLFYAPWLAFPVKQERSSGLLVPEFGYSDRDGFNTRLPFFFVVDESTDFSLTPFAQTETRYGTEIEYRKAYSLRSSFEGKLFYSDESPRDGELRGTDITNIAEPEIDENRLGLYAKQMWSNSSSSSVPLSLVSDIHWVSDTLLLRELNASEIGLPSNRYATSRIALRGQFSDFVSSSLVGEYFSAFA
jgi:LPS-assembly protein